MNYTLTGCRSFAEHLPKNHPTSSRTKKLNLFLMAESYHMKIYLSADRVYFVKTMVTGHNNYTGIRNEPAVMICPNNSHW